MAGDRLRAARLLAQHLVLSTRDRVAVIAFQGDVLVQLISAALWLRSSPVIGAEGSWSYPFGPCLQENNSVRASAPESTDL